MSIYIRDLIIGYVGFNGLLFAAILYIRYSVNAVKDWPSAPGTITESREVTIRSEWKEAHGLRNYAGRRGQ